MEVISEYSYELARYIDEAEAKSRAKDPDEESFNVEAISKPVCATLLAAIEYLQIIREVMSTAM
jgi:hypothetical protein